jgi:hypothetical protein
MIAKVMSLLRFRVSSAKTEDTDHKEEAEAGKRVSYAKAIDTNVKKQLRHYEIYGHLQYQINRLTAIVVGCIAVIILLLFINIFIARKQPYVIRVDAEGKLTGFQELNENLRVTDIEITTFAKDFMEKFIAFNSAVAKEKLADSLNMMTPKFQEAAIEDIKEKNFVKKIEEMKIRTILKFKDAEIVERPQNKFFVRLNGKSEVYSLLKQEGKPVSVKNFTAEVLLVAVPRTEKTARGLLADSFIHSYDLSKKEEKDEKE